MTRFGRQAALVGAACLGLVLTAGCGSGSGKDSDADRSPVNAASPVCVQQASTKQVSLPAGFPSDFPLPPGTVLYAVDNRGADGIVVTGVTGTAFKTVLSSLQTGLPAHGYTPEEGETEPHDAESNWHSAGYTGRWAIREIPQCAGQTLVNVVARANSSAAPSS